jgi:PAS domain S-box-containing protein
MNNFINKHFVSNEKKRLWLLISLVAATLLTLGFVNLSNWLKDYQFTKKELLGLQYHGLLYKTLISAERLRGESYLLSSSHSESSQIETLKQTLAQNISNVDQVSSTAKLLEMSPQWQESKQSLQKDFFSHDIQVSPEELFAIRTKSIDQLQQLLNHLARQSNLVLDPEIKSSDFMSLVVNIIPTTTSILGYWRGNIAGLKNQADSLNSKERLNLYIALGKISSLRSEYQRTYTRLHVTDKNSVGMPIELYALDRQIAIFEQVANDKDFTDAESFFKETTNNIKVFQDAYLTNQVSLNTLLEQRLNKHTRNILLLISLISLAGFACIGFMVVINKNYEHQIEAAAQLQSVFDTVIDGIIVIDDYGIIQNTNASAPTIFGYTSAEILGKNVNMLMPEKQKNEHDGHLKHYRDTGEARIIGKGREVTGRRKDGTQFAIDIAISETMLRGKRMFVGTTRDVSEKRYMEKLHRLMSENVEGYATLILDANGKIKTWNKGAEVLKGYTKDEIIGESFEKFYTPEALAKNLPSSLLETCIKVGHVHDEGWRVRKDGSQFYAEVVLNRLQEDDGSLLGFVKVTRDVTDRKQIDNELRQAYANLEEFTAVASHDLKSPIRGIADLVEWIKEDLEKDFGENLQENVRVNLDRIQLRIKRMEMLIEDLLQYSRAGRVSAEISLIDPLALIQEILEIQPLPAGFNLSLTGHATAFKTAKTPLQTSLRNLISNALKHHDKKEGHIDISVKTEGSYCVFTVKDDGPGIPKSAQERVFKLFQTLSKTNASSGLGLAVSKRMVEAHGGFIELESNSEVRGTTFRVWWPKFKVNTKANQQVE